MLTRLAVNKLLHVTLAGAAARASPNIFGEFTPRALGAGFFRLIFRQRGMSTLLDVFTLTTPLLDRIDAFYFRFLRRIIKIPASYISRVTNHTVWAQANYPKKPSEFILKTEQKLILRTFQAPREDPMHNVLFASGFRDRVNLQGRRRGRPTPTWLQTIPKRRYQAVSNHTAPQLFFANIARHRPSGDSFVELAPMRARERARPSQKSPKCRSWCPQLIYLLLCS